MATIRVTNGTGAPVSIPDVGVVIPAVSFSIFTDPALVRDLAVSADLRALVTALTLSISDGVTALTLDDLEAFFTFGGRNPAKGSVPVATTPGMASLPVGADGEVLTADSSADEGVSWQPSSSGTGALGFLSVAVNTALVAADVNKVVLATAGVGGITITLPDPTLAGVIGRRIYIKKVDAAVGLVTVDNFAAETIDGATSVAIASQYQTLEVVSDGTNWHII
jgi:hypothetical protein